MYSPSGELPLAILKKVVQKTMEIKYNLAGSERKSLVTAIGEILGVKPAYQGAPSFAYEIETFTVDKEGTLSFSDSIKDEASRHLLGELSNRGFTAEISSNGLVIEIPKEGFTGTALTNLHHLVESKDTLIKKAIGADTLTIKETENTLCFPWFPFTDDGETVKAYTHLVHALCEMAKGQHLITAKPKSVENEKYAFRCFLLRLGFIGPEYKTERKILLEKLTGNGAFKAKEAAE
jgi:hypothetical protein